MNWAEMLARNIEAAFWCKVLHTCTTREALVALVANRDRSAWEKPALRAAWDEAEALVGVR